MKIECIRRFNLNYARYSNAFVFRSDGIERVHIYNTYKITCGVEPPTDSRATRFRTYPPLHPLPGYLALSTSLSRYPVLLLTFHLSCVTLILWPRDNLPYRPVTLSFHFIHDYLVEPFKYTPIQSNM